MPMTAEKIAELRAAVSDEALDAACRANIHPLTEPSDVERRKMRRALEAAALVASDETAWLIEFSGQGGPCYYGKTDEGVLGLTWDHLVAVRFARAEDAQAVIDDTNWTEAKPVEHMWSARRALSSPEGTK